METSGDAGRANDVEATEGAETGAVIRTFLIADVRGYTSFTRAHGEKRPDSLPLGSPSLPAR
jgi:hypothetical protein